MVKKILVIEDQPETRNLFVSGLKAKGFQVFGVEDGRVGVQQAQKLIPNLIVSGIMIPELNGYDVLATLRRDPITAVIPVIFVTAKMTRTDLRKAMELGAADYLTKPCTIEELARAIAAQFEKQTVLQQWYTSQPQAETTSDTAESTSDYISHTTWTWPTEPQLSEVFQFIEANYHRPITLSDVAQAVGYSPAYLTHLMGRQTGETVQRWIIKRRMAAARSLLLETDLLIEQIAEQVGYHSIVHFFRQFRQLHATTPQAWRSAHRMRGSA